MVSPIILCVVLSFVFNASVMFLEYVIFLLLFMVVCEYLFGRGDFDVFEILIEGITGVVELFDEFNFVLFRIDVECSSQHNHFYLVGFMTG